MSFLTWWQGRVEQVSYSCCAVVNGAVVTLRHMPGYPRVDKGNDTLLARYDGAVVDALPWQQLSPPAEGGMHEAGMVLPAWRRLLEVSPPPPLQYQDASNEFTSRCSASPT